MTEQLFRVLFDGTLTGEFDDATTRRRFGKLFRLDDKKTAVLFSGKEFVIKNNVTETQAMAFMIRVSEAGCECYVQEMPDEDEPDFEEKRKTGERRLRWRRGPRPGAIIPDRRLFIRRKKDRRYFVDVRAHGHDMPLALRSYPKDAADN